MAIISMTLLRYMSGQIFVDDASKANLLNEYFSTVGTVDNGILPTSRDKLPVLDHFRFRHAPCSAAILSKEYITRTTISR